MAAVLSEKINLSWRNHSSSMFGSFKRLREDGELFDLTLACHKSDSDSDSDSDVVFIPAHKVVLAASSPVFRSMVMRLSKSPDSMLYLSDIRHEHAKAVVDFIYSGQVDVDRSMLEGFLKTAAKLQVEGLGSAANADGKSPSPKKRKIVVAERDLDLEDPPKDEDCDDSWQFDLNNDAEEEEVKEEDVKPEDKPQVLEAEATDKADSKPVATEGLLVKGKE